MFKRLPFKKEQLLITGTVILFVLCYQLAFKKTFSAWQLHSRLNRQLINAANLNYQPAYIKRKNHNLDQIIDLYKIDSIAFRNNIISNIASIAEKENVKLSEVPMQDPLYHTDRSIIQKLDFEGDYFSLVKLLKDLQKAKGIGILRSFDLKKVEIRSKNEVIKKLMMEIYLETAK